MDSGQPLVSVVTPFYNTARYLRECIESVLAQSWTNYEYILSDNASDDGSLDIANEYASRDRRLRVVANREHVSQVPNYNRALREISPASRYCKIVQADDWVYPECLERMIEVAESDPEVGIVSSYCVLGDSVLGTGLPPGRTVFDGREIARRQLIDSRFFFGTPTTVLFQSAIVREHDPFYDEGALHEDTEACYEILRRHKFGFVHQVLSHLRIDDGSISGAARGLEPHGLDKLIVILKYGPYYLTGDEYRSCLADHERNYYRLYLRRQFGPGRKAFRRYHGETLRKVGYRFSRKLMARTLAAELADVVFNPKHTVGRLVERLRTERDREPQNGGSR